MGYDLTPANPLPADTTAVRFALGQLELGRPEFSAVKVKILADPGATCAKMYGDAFGGDAGGTDSGKDHIWRYFDPTVVSLSPCVMLQKTVSKALVAPGEVFYYTIVFANNGSVALPNITLTDTLPAGVTYLSAQPPPTTSASPTFTWNLGTVQPGSMVVITNWVKAASIGTHFNNVTARSGAEIIGAANQSVEVAYRSLLQKVKTVTPSAVAAGDAVDYTITIDNDGTGGNGVPLIVRDYLPAGFAYQSLLSATLNGASIASPTIAVNATDPAAPAFTVSQSIAAGKSLVIRFRALVGAAVEPGTYFNNVELLYEGKRQPPIPEAPVTVAGGKIGDTIYRDWDGDGTQDAGEEGIAGVPVNLYAADGTTLLATTTTDASGNYYFAGLQAGTYVVKVNGGSAPAGTAQTADPDGTFDNAHTVALADNVQYMTADFGYKPAGTATLGDQVFEDIGQDGVFTPGSDSGIPGVTVWLYEDGNGNGVVDAGDALVAATQSDANGNYLFSNLAPGFNYLAKVDSGDPDLQTYFDAKYAPDPVPFDLSTAQVSSSPNLAGDDLDNDFGFWRVVPGSIGDLVFIDADGDGAYDAGETPLSGVTVTLSRNGQVVATAVTGPDGAYRFENLGPGDYVVAVDAGSAGVPAGHSSSAGPFTVTLASGADYLLADFPFVPLITKSVDKAYAGAGTNLLFSINIANGGSQPLSDLRVIDPLPPGVTFGSATAGGVYGPYVSLPGAPSENSVPALGMAVYNNNNDTFRYRTWNADDGFSSETLGANMGVRIQMMAGASSPTTAERVVTFMDGARHHVFAAIWNGTAWTPVPTPPATTAQGRMTSTPLTANSQQFWGSAVAYEQSSGHLMMIWNGDSTVGTGTDQLRYVTREGGTWGTVATIATADQPQNLRLTALPNSDKLALVYSTASGGDYAMIWSGTAWGPIQALDTAGGSLTSVNVAYETQSGRAVVVYGKPTATSPNLFYRLWDGSSWSAESSVTPPAGVTTQPQWVAIASDPFSNRIAAGVVTSGGKTWLAVWDGSAWVNVEQATASSLITTAQNVAVAFETLSGDILAAYGVNSAPTAQVRFRTWTWDPVAQTGAWSAELAGPTATSGNPNVILLARSPTTDRIMLSVNTSASRANYVSWDGGAWDDTVLEASGKTKTKTATQQPMIYLWNRASAEQSSSMSLTANPTTAAIGAPITVTLAIKSTQTIGDVVPVLSVMGGTATVSTSETFPITVTGGATRLVVYTVTPTSAGDIHFHATATGAGDYDFGNTDSNTVLVTPSGKTEAVIWNLGSNEPGTEGVTAANKLLYAFAGNDQLAFWAYNTASSAWNSPDPADTPAGVTIKEGGALTTDGTRYIYALRGDNTRVFLRYDTTAGTWEDAGIADLPTTTDKTVMKGGSLTYLNGYVYAFIGNDSLQFWRYDVVANTWSQMANALGTVNNGAGLTTDGVNLYATQGGRKGFWRYNVAANTWTALTPFADNFGDGGGLVYANGAIYVLRGDGKTTFRRYNIAANSWTTLAVAPAAIDDGGAIGFDGTYVYALRGKSNGFYRYDTAANAWTTLAAAPANVQWGGSLAFLASGSVTRTTATASPMLVGGVSQVVLRMTVTSVNAVNNIAPTTPTYTAVNGVTATVGSATLVSPDDDIAGSGDPVVYEWIATVTAGAVPGDITFTLGNNAGTGASALANSVLVAPAMTWTGSVTGSAPPVIRNTAIINEFGEGSIQNVPSGTTETYTSASIGDFVWLDGDGDGVQDAGETGLSGVRVEIYAADGVTLLGSDVTDAAGAYRVGGLAAGSYVVKTVPETYPSGYVPTTSGTLNVAIAAGEQYAAADFGLWPAPVGTGSIGDRLWLDADGDGMQDAGETGLEGISVVLERLIGGVWTTVATQTTGTNGLYDFTQLLDGDYRVSVATNSLVASPFGGSYALGSAMAPTYDADGTGTPNAALVTLNATQRVYDSLDFGYNWSGSIGDTVWWDADLDGVKDAGELPATNAFVMVYFDFNGNGILDPTMGDYQIASARTDANGHYLIENLPSGPYLVDVYEDSLTTGGIRDVVPTTSEVVYHALGAGEAFLAADFGYFQGARVDGNVFWDDNRNAYYESAEQGLTNVTVTLTGTDMFGNPVTRTTTTDADGHYTFLVPEGDYAVSYSNPTLLAGYPSLGDATTATSYTFHAYPGEDGNRTSYDFGVDSSGRIGDTVFADVNGTPGQQAGEAGLAGVTVRLYANPDGSAAINGDETLLEVTVTDALGQYLFTGLADGGYLVEVVTATLPPEYTTTPTTDPTGASDSQGAAQIVNGSSVLTVDFGYPLAPKSYNISGTIYDDNGAEGGSVTNGLQDGAEPGLAGVRVVIEVGTNSLYQTYVVYTDANGFYSLDGIPEGSDVRITVDESTLPNGAYVQSGDPNGTPLSEVWTITDLQADANDLDFGYRAQYGAISGTVVDGNGDGMAGTGEPALTNVTVTLLYAGSDGIFGTADDTTVNTVTDANGAYAFANLVPGNYRIVETDPAGYVSLADADGGNPNIIDVIGLAPGQNVVGRDFEDTPPDRFLGDFVWHDLNGDGVQDLGEPGLSNVTVRLLSAGPDGIPATADDVLEGTVVTDAAGSYRFEGLAPASYLIVIDAATLPAGFAAYPSEDLDGTNSPNQAVASLDSSAGRLDVDFGYFPPAAIGNQVWEDLNGNGLQDLGEPVLTNVTVRLYDASSNLLASVLSDATGAYLFDNLLPGTYFVQAVPPEGYLPTRPYAGEDDAVDSDGDALGWSAPVATLSGQMQADADFGFNRPARLYGYAFWDKDANLARNAGDGSASGMVVQVWSDNVQVAATNAAANGFYEFLDLVPGTYEVRFVCNTTAVIAVPVSGAAATDPERNRVVVAGADYAAVTYTINSGHGVGEDVGEPVNAGFTGGGPMSSGIGLQAFQGSDGVYVEFVAYDVEEDGYVTLYLVGPGDTVLWYGTYEVAAGPRQVCRFLVPGLVVGGVYNFVVQDEVNQFWEAYGVRVTPFAAELIRMSLAGVTLAFPSLPEREYEIQWVRRLGDVWQTVTNVLAEGERTTVVVPHPDRASPSGFFRIRLK